MIRISSILIGVSDLHKARPFYENLFGMRFEEFRPPFASAMLGELEFSIEENTPERGSDWANLYIGGRKRVSFKTDNLEFFIKQVELFDGKVVKEIELKPWGWKEAIISDLDGNEFIIEEEVDKSY